jgi:hypothetical protein
MTPIISALPWSQMKYQTEINDNISVKLDFFAVFHNGAGNNMHAKMPHYGYYITVCPHESVTVKTGKEINSNVQKH